MEIILIRHGESEADILQVHEGRADFSLTLRGKKQAEQLAIYLSSHYQIDKIYCSTLKRARETAAYLLKATPYPIEYLDDLREFNNGVLAGLSFEEAKEKYPKPIGGRRPHEKIEKGESELEFRFRAEEVYSKIQYENLHKRIAIVSHGGMINQLLNVIYELPVVSSCLFRTGDTGFHIIEIKNGKKDTIKLNCQEHLSEDLK